MLGSSKIIKLGSPVLSSIAKYYEKVLDWSQYTNSFIKHTTNCIEKVYHFIGQKLHQLTENRLQLQK